MMDNIMHFLLSSSTMDAGLLNTGYIFGIRLRCECSYMRGHSLQPDSDAPSTAPHYHVPDNRRIYFLVIPFHIFPAKQLYFAINFRD